jgi:transmembrane protein TMEM174 (potassium channel)
MLFSLLSHRDGPVAEGEPFRWRGEGVSRIEGLSDTVFGFAITLLVVSLEVPKTSAELLENMLGFVPFVASFSVLFMIWRTQFQFFRHYGLEDKPTVRLTGMLLMGVLFAIYPLKFLFGFLLLTLPRAMLFGNADAVKQVMPLSSLPMVMGLYGFGVLWIAMVFSRLYAHAQRCRESLGLTALEAFDTDAMRRRWRNVSLLGATIVAWCLTLLAISDHMRQRDTVFDAVYYGGAAMVFAVSLSQARYRRRLVRERRVVLGFPGADDASTSAVSPR